jgi:hypothetical protein
MCSHEFLAWVLHLELHKHFVCHDAFCDTAGACSRGVGGTSVCTDVVNITGVGGACVRQCR